MGEYLLHRHAENLQQSLLEFKANYKLPKDQEKPNPVCMVAKQAYLWNYCQQKTKSRNEPYSDTPCAASWSSASNVFWKNRAHYRSLPCLPVSELCKILIILCTGECTLKCINLQSHVHTVTHCVISFPLSTHWRKKNIPRITWVWNAENILHPNHIKSTADSLCYLPVLFIWLLHAGRLSTCRNDHALSGPRLSAGREGLAVLTKLPWL